MSRSVQESPRVIVGYTKQSEELKSYFHCTIKTCKGGGKAALRPGGEHLACGALAPPSSLGGGERAGVGLERGLRPYCEPGAKRHAGQMTLLSALSETHVQSEP